MKPSRSRRLFRLIAALLALFSLLFTQLAAASCVCGAMSGAMGGVNMLSVSASADTKANAAMINCADMAMEQPAVCQAHAENAISKQSLDKPQLPDVTAFVFSGLVLTLPAVEFVLPPPRVSASVLLARSTAPPISIRNCCFRI